MQLLNFFGKVVWQVPTQIPTQNCACIKYIEILDDIPHTFKFNSYSDLQSKRGAS
jgi:hypothetical protein